MEKKKLAVCIGLKDGKAVEYDHCEKWLGSGDAAEIARYYSDNGLDVLFVRDFSREDKEHDKNIGILREINRVSEMQIYAGGNIKRLEDVKKLIYAGAEKVILDLKKDSNLEILSEAKDRFGRERLAVLTDGLKYSGETESLIRKNASETIGKFKPEKDLGIPSFILGADEEEVGKSLLKMEGISGISGDFIENCVDEIMSVKHRWNREGIPMEVFYTEIEFKDFKLNGDGLIPAIVQDYRTKEVLMLAYMNEEAFNRTVETGKMTYFSRSRKSLWLKGETSGHFQYVKALYLDCDNDTLLAEVSQVGAACHTGSKSCFFKEIVKKDYKEANPLKVLEEVYGTILDRKKNPKEGSYTNYLFDKGIDKILKKVGEEATEIVIAAKNPDKEEIKYEIADFLYHAMVLMAEREVTWEDITKELTDRH